jgi:hypothetical protein
VTIHNATIRHPNWHEVKGKVIARFKTVKAAARMIGCHPNSIRNAAEGRSPNVWKKLSRYV